MVTYHEVTDSVAPVPVEYKRRNVFLPSLTELDPRNFDYVDWMIENPMLFNFSVHLDDVPAAKQLALNLHEAYLTHKDSKHPTVLQILDQLKILQMPEVDYRSPGALWIQGAQTMKEYLDPYNTNAVRNLLSSRYSVGTVLEALSGHRTYFRHSTARSLVAIDGCEESLLRYDYPNARRICCNLDQLADGCELDFFPDNSFDAVSVCFGYKYPIDILKVLREFFRILKPGKEVSFIESMTQGYLELVKRDFYPMLISADLESAGFKNVKSAPIENRFYKDGGDALDFKVSKIIHTHAVAAK